MMKHWHVAIYHGTLGFSSHWVIAASPGEAVLVAAMTAAYDDHDIASKLADGGLLIAGFQIHDIQEVRYAHVCTTN